MRNECTRKKMRFLPPKTQEMHFNLWLVSLPRCADWNLGNPRESSKALTIMVHDFSDTQDTPQHRSFPFAPASVLHLLLQYNLLHVNMCQTYPDIGLSWVYILHRLVVHFRGICCWWPKSCTSLLRPSWGVDIIACIAWAWGLEKVNQAYSPQWCCKMVMNTMVQSVKNHLKTQIQNILCCLIGILIIVFWSSPHIWVEFQPLFTLQGSFSRHRALPIFGCG